MLQQRADELGKQIKSLSETKRIVDSIVKISNENGIESVNLYQLLKELIYLNKNNEGMIGLMKHEYKDIIKITVGKELIPICDPQQGEILLNAIKLMRKEIETKTNKKIPLIRVVDIETLSDYEYEIYIKDIKVFSGSLDAIDKNNYVKDIIGKLSQIIEKKMNEITEG
jgi:flagellar biosynthesis component FlhA